MTKREKLIVSIIKFNQNELYDWKLSSNKADNKMKVLAKLNERITKTIKT